MPITNFKPMHYIAFEENDEEVSIHPEWFLEIPDELDVCVAQRHFEEALTLLEKARDFSTTYTAPQNQEDHIFADIMRKVTFQTLFKMPTVEHIQKILFSG